MEAHNACGKCSINHHDPQATVGNPGSSGRAAKSEQIHRKSNWISFDVAVLNAQLTADGGLKEWIENFIIILRI